MKKKKKHSKAGVKLVGILFAVIVALCGWSSSNHHDGHSGFSFGGRAVNFAGGQFPADSEEISVVLQPGETALLDQFEALRTADFSGSTCLGEITAWAAANPSVSVRYTVTLPGGQTLPNDAESVDLSGLGESAVSQAATSLAFLPRLREIELGSAFTAEEVLSAEAIGALQAACPGAAVNYSVSILGGTYNLSAAEVDLSGMSPADVPGTASLLAALTQVSSVYIGDKGELSWQDIETIQNAVPGAALDCTFEAFGKTISLSDEVLDLNHITMNDGGAAVREFLPYMKNLKTLDMDYCGVSNEDMASIREDFPEVDVIWRIWFGHTSMYSVRTDTERILASKMSVAGLLDNAEADKLKYCTKVKYLDLGHNDPISDISFVANMPDLEVFIIAMSAITDISPLQNCMHLEYLEIFTTGVSDLSPLADKTELRHLNIGQCPITDISPLYGLTELERLWIGALTPVPADQIAQMHAAAPNCVIDTTANGGDGIGPTQGWKYYYISQIHGWDEPHYVKRYSDLSYQLGYQNQQYSFYWLDPLCGDPAPAEYATTYQYVPQDQWTRLGYDLGDGVMHYYQPDGSISSVY